MGFLSRLFGPREKEGKRQEEEPQAEVTSCPHTALNQHWDLPEQIGNAELARYVCDACGESFSYQQAQMFLEKATELFPTEEEKKLEV